MATYFAPSICMHLTETTGKVGKLFSSTFNQKPSTRKYTFKNTSAHSSHLLCYVVAGNSFLHEFYPLVLLINISLEIGQCKDFFLCLNEELQNNSSEFFGKLQYKQVVAHFM